MKLCLSVSIALAMLTTTDACAAPRLGSEYTLYIDPGFSLSQQDVIVTVAADWEEHVPVHFFPVVAKCSGVNDGIICVHAATREQIKKVNPAASNYTRYINGAGHRGDTGGWFGRDGGECFIDAGQPDIYFQPSVAHELGHAMGLEHQPDKGTVMYPGLDGISAWVTTEDAEQWRAIRQ
jgi:hypothetical protein